MRGPFKARTRVATIGVVAILQIAAGCDAHHVEPAPGFRTTIVTPQPPRDPWGKGVGDLDADGLPDVVIGGNGSMELVWYANPGWEKRIIATGRRFSTDQEVADLDNDGAADVVSVTKESLLWYRRSGDAWSEMVVDDVTLHDIEITDIDLDGDLDVIGRNQGAFAGSGATLFVYRTEPGPRWTREEIDCPDGEGLAIADINDDDFDDVVLNGVLYLNNASSMSEWTEVVFAYDWTWPHVTVDVGDIDGNGLLDIVLAPAELAGQHYRISWFEQPTLPPFTWHEHVIDSHVESVHHFLGASDFDLDGDTDIATAEMHQGKDPDEIKLYVNEGEGTSWTKRVLATSGSHAMRVVDLDLDGDDDLVGANWSGDHQALEAYVNTACEPGWNSWRRHELDAARPWRAVFVTSADVDGDGLPDVLAGGWWYRNPGNLVSPWERISFGDGAANLAAVVDGDGDGDLDVIATAGRGAEPNGEFVWAENDGTGAFTVHRDRIRLDGDFLQGVAVGRFGEQESVGVAISWHASGKGVQLVSLPSDPSSQAWGWSEASPTSQNEALSTGDVDRDGDLDLVLGTRWLRNEGESWTRFELCPDCPAPDRNIVTDLNGDGRLDVVVGYEAISRPGPVAWYESGADPTAPWVEHMIGRPVGPMSLDVGDVDLDGDLDVIVGEHDLKRPKDARLLVYENRDGRGLSWHEHVVYMGDEHHDGAHLFDADLDGDLDVVSIGWSHDRVVLYENRWIPCRSAGVPMSIRTTPETDP